MKLICQDATRLALQVRLQPYEQLQVTLLEKGMDYDGVAIRFQMDRLDELFEVLDTLLKHQEIMVIGLKDGRMYPISSRDILYIEGYRKEAYLHTLQDTYEITYRLYEAEELLQEESFQRINKSTLVNIRHIISIHPAFNACYTLEMSDGVCLECSRQYWKIFKKRLQMR